MEPVHAAGPNGFHNRICRTSTGKDGPATFRTTENVCALDQPRFIAWKTAFGAHCLLLAVREQHLESVNETSCSHYNTHRLTGVLSPVVLVCFGGYMRHGFADVAEGLKACAEATYAEPGTN